MKDTGNSESGSRTSVLIVDDNENNLQIAAKVISKAGYWVMLAPDGNSALELIEKTTPDAILLDIMMPEMSGLEVCKIIKSIEKYADIPILFLSADGDEDSIEEGLILGGVDYITKPFNEKILLARLRTHIDRALHQKEIAGYAHVLEEKNEKLEEMRREILKSNADLEEQIGKNLQVLATLNDKIRNPLSIVITLLEMQEDRDSSLIIEHLNRIDRVVDDLDKGFVDSEKVKAYLYKHSDYFT
jgi:two-component system sensor histidine kinase/response regulator